MHQETLLEIVVFYKIYDICKYNADGLYRLSHNTKSTSLRVMYIIRLHMAGKFFLVIKIDFIKISVHSLTSYFCWNM